MLHEFLLKNQDEILAMTEEKSLDLAGTRASSDALKRGLPLFYEQLISILRIERGSNPGGAIDVDRIVRASAEAEDLASSDDGTSEAEVAKSAGLHGKELLRLGYTVSHVVQAYGAMCQAITELATTKDVRIAPGEFRDLNRCLDIAIAGAVTEYQIQSDTQGDRREVEHLGFLAHELRNALNIVNVSLLLIKKGTVGFGGSTGQVLDRGLKRIEELIDRSLTEVRLRVDPKIHAEAGNLLQIVDQLVVTAEVEARSRSQSLQVQVDPTLVFEADQPLFYSALSNLIQNALKYTRPGGTIHVRGVRVGRNIVVEVEDECGGLPSETVEDLFAPFEQRHADRRGLGLGLTIARRAITLNRGTLGVRNLPGKGCIFTIILPGGADSEGALPA